MRPFRTLSKLRRFWSARVDALKRHLDRMDHAKEDRSTPPKRETRKKGEEDDRSRAVHTGSGQRRGGAEGRRKVDAHSRQRTAPLAGKSLAGAYRPSASARVGSL